MDLTELRTLGRKDAGDPREVPADLVGRDSGHQEVDMEGDAETAADGGGADLSDAPTAVDTGVDDAGQSADIPAVDTAPEVREDGRVAEFLDAKPGMDSGAEAMSGPDSLVPDPRDIPDGGSDTDPAGDVSLDGTGSIDVGSASDATIATPIKLTGTPFGSGPPYANDTRRGFEKAFDGDITSYVDDSNVSGGYVGIDLGNGTLARVSSIRFYPRANNTNRMVGGEFQCSTSSPFSGFVRLYTIASLPFLGWNQVAITGATPCRYLRYAAPPNSYTNVAEIEFWGVVP